ncbi:hypothetical protein OPV22_002996 [Ensete ventricosum]|uniref:Uncharacterized protein n=1 Tax=Ensete ventricosum TaxID=4639 RepID=A0AAV8RZB0_ENSVE|nr:hypothetical protein OPV22_002996 [Ensete ventricosum]
MAFPCSPKHSGLAIALCLLLIYRSYYIIHLTSTLLTLLLLVLATFFPLLGQLGKACFKEQPSGAAAAALPQDVVFADQRAALEEFVSYHNDEAVSVSEDPSLKYEITSGLLSVEASSSQENLSQSTLQCSNSSDESLLDDVCHLKESFEGSISDDENLIEIIIPDDHFVVPEVSKAWLKPLPDISRGLLTNLVPEPGLHQMLKNGNHIVHNLDVEAVKISSANNAWHLMVLQLVRHVS